MSKLLDTHSRLLIRSVDGVETTVAVLLYRANVVETLQYHSKDRQGRLVFNRSSAGEIGRSGEGNNEEKWKTNDNERSRIGTINDRNGHVGASGEGVGL